MMVKLLKEHTWFILILFSCISLRFFPFFNYQFTLDELSGLGRTTFSSFDDLVEKGVKTSDTHPALIQILLFCFAKLFGYANWVIKLPFLLMSFGSIIYGYLFSLRNFSKQAGIFSSIILSFSLIFVFYAPIARMYVSGVFFSMALLFYFFEIFFLNHTKFFNYFFLGLFALLSALNQHLNGLFALTLCASGLVFLNNSNFKSYLITCTVVVVCYLPHLPVTLYQFNIGGIGFDQGGWLPIPEKDALWQFLKVLLGTGKTYVVFLFFIGLSFIMNKRVYFTKKQTFLLAIFLLNYFIIYFYSVYRAPVFQYSVMLFSSVALVILIASLLQFKNKYVFHSIVVVLSSVLVYKTYFKKDYFHQAVKTIFEYQFERTTYYKKLYGDHEVYPIFFDADIFMKTIYFDKYHCNFKFKMSSDSVVFNTKYFSDFVANLDCNYLALASSTPAHQAIVAQYFPYLIENTQTQGINYKMYSKKAEDKSLVVENDKQIGYSNVSQWGSFNYGKMKQTSGQSSLMVSVDSLSEYPFDAKARYADFITSEGQVLLLKARYKLKNVDSGKITTCISINDEVNNNMYMYNSKEVGEFIVNPDSTVTVFVDSYIGTQHRSIKDKSRVSAYVWNKGKNMFNLIDFEIALIDFWHWKWHFWD